MDLFLKFKSEEEAIAHLYEIIPEQLNEKGEVTKQTELRPKFANIDIVGVIYKPTGKTKEHTLDNSTVVVPIMEQLEGWHVNVRVVNEEDVSELQQFSITPKNPQRVWA